MKARLKAATGKDDKSHPKSHNAGDGCAEVADAEHAPETATAESTHSPLCFSTTTPFREWSSAQVTERGAEGDS